MKLRGMKLRVMYKSPAIVIITLTLVGYLLAILIMIYQNIQHSQMIRLHLLILYLAKSNYQNII